MKKVDDYTPEEIGEILSYPILAGAESARVRAEVWLEYRYPGDGKKSVSMDEASARTSQDVRVLAATAERARAAKEATTLKVLLGVLGKGE